jgi:hypothetical protein
MFPRLNIDPLIQPSLLLTASHSRLDAGAPQPGAPQAALIAVFFEAATTSVERYSAGPTSAPPRSAPALWRSKAKVDWQNLHRPV